MKKQWFTGWFGSGQAAAGQRATPASAAAAFVPAAVPRSDIDALFHRWLTGAAVRPPVPASAQVLLDELERLAQSPGAGAHLVPRVPAVIPQLLRSLRDDSLSAGDLSRMLAQDVVLVAEVIRGANSPFYSPSAPVKTIEGAVMLLGENGMRLLLARVAFRPVISTQSGTLARLAAPHAWRQAEKCAVAANLLAPRLHANPFEAYLAGLMQNVGLIVAFRLFDQLNPDLVLPQSDAFYDALVKHARTLSARIAGMWEFPPAVARAIGEAGQPISPLARTLALADRIAKLRMLVDAGQLDERDPGVLADLDETALACYRQLRTLD